MKKRTYLNPMETEEILGKARKDAEISEVTEREVVKGWLNRPSQLEMNLNGLTRRN